MILTFGNGVINKTFGIIGSDYTTVGALIEFLLDHGYSAHISPGNVHGLGFVIGTAAEITRFVREQILPSK